MNNFAEIHYLVDFVNHFVPERTGKHTTKGPGESWKNTWDVLYEPWLHPSHPLTLSYMYNKKWCVFYFLSCQDDAETACEIQLHERLSCLLAELEPYEQKLLQLNKKMKIKLRKEHENYVEEPPDKQQVIMLMIF